MTADNVGKSYRSIEETKAIVYAGERRMVQLGLRTGLITPAEAEETLALAKANYLATSPEEYEAWHFDEIADNADAAWVKTRVRDIRVPMGGGLVAGPFYDYWVGSPGRRAGKSWRVTAITPPLIRIGRPSRGYARHIRRQKAKGLRK